MKPSRRARLLLGAVAAFACIAADAATGEQLFAQCVACHGPQAAGNPATQAPAIAGQRAAYVQRQLQNFRAGVRGVDKADAPGAQMRSIALTLPNDAAVASVAAYVAGLPETTAKPAAGADLHNGNNLYQGKCGACHGTQAEGNDALSTPRLAGLDAVYVRRQFQHFAQGVRGAHPQDRYGKQMAMMSKSVATPKDLDDVIAYLQASGATK